MPDKFLGGLTILLFISGGLQGAYGSPNPHTDPTLDAISWVLAGHPQVSKAVIALSYLFVCCFATTIGPTSWTYTSEIFPSKIRAKAVSLATASNWAWNCARRFHFIAPTAECEQLIIVQLPLASHRCFGASIGRCT